MKTKNAKEIAKIDRQLDRLEAEFATMRHLLFYVYRVISMVFSELNTLCNRG